MRERGAMASGLGDDHIEQLRARKYREATERLTELERKELNDSLSILEAVTSRVEAGDRSAMLELLAIAAASLRWPEALPQKTRDDLAIGLEKMLGSVLN
jgi:hypothetical protein